MYVYLLASVIHALAEVVTFPEGLIWPSLTHHWYAAVCAAWLPIGAAWFALVWRDEGRSIM